MGFTFSVTTGKGGRVAVYLVDGRLTDGRDQVIFTDKIFAGEFAEIEADYWLHFCDDFARFMGAYLVNGVHSTGRECVESNV
jgi:hypothetical protein